MPTFQLLISVLTLYTAQSDLTLHLNSSIFASQSTAWLYYSISPAQSSALLELRIETGKTAALLAARAQGPPLYISASDYLIADEVDYEGWFSAKTQQYLNLNAGIMRKGAIVGVFFNQSASEWTKVAYQISLWEGRKCPFDCSGNGVCDSNSACKCDGNHTASDCSLSDHQLSEKTPLNVNLASLEWTYFSINLSECNFYPVSSSSLIANLNWSNAGLEILTKNSFSHQSPLPSPFEYTSRHTALAGPIEVPLNEEKATMWRLAIRVFAGYEGANVRIEVRKGGNDTGKRIFWGLISCAAVGIVLFAGLGIGKYCRYRRRQLAFKYANQNSTLSGMPNSLVDIHFPVHLFEDAKTAQVACPICLDTFLPIHLTRELPCSHQFHSACITTWFQTNTHCCVCHRDYSSLADRAESCSYAEKTISIEDDKLDFSRQTETNTQNETQTAELFSFRT